MGNIIFPQGRMIEVQKRGILRTPEKLGGLEEIPDFCTVPLVTK